MNELAQWAMEWIDKFNAGVGGAKIPNACLDSLVDLLERVREKERSKIKAALGILSVVRCTCQPPRGPMCDRHLLERALTGGREK